MAPHRNIPSLAGGSTRRCPGGRSVAWATLLNDRAGNLGFAYLLTPPPANFRLVPIDHRLGLLATELAVALQLRGADAILMVVIRSDLHLLALAGLDRQLPDR